MIASFSSKQPRPFARALLIAAGFAFAELIAGLTIGAFLLRGRAEVAIFLAFRPWLLLATALIVLRRPWRERWTAYLAAILLTSASEALLVHLLGSPDALVEAGWALLASAPLAWAIDLAALAGRWLRGWRGLLLAGSAVIGLLLLPGPLLFFERLALRGESEASGSRPPLLLLTGLPLVWGEAAAPPPAFKAVLERSYAVRPIDVAADGSFAGEGLLLIAQPRPPGPAGLVAIDRWVRKGGRALILTDPELRWPSDYPQGDPRRPPATDGLGPLLAHWGLRLDGPDDSGLITRDIGGRRVVMAAPGRFTHMAGECVISLGGLLADCAIGKGRALLFADADLLHDLLWAGPGRIGTARAGRLADNPLLVTKLLDRLTGDSSADDTGRIVWITKPQALEEAVVSALLLPIASILVTWKGSFRLVRRRREKDSDRVIHRQEGET